MTKRLPIAAASAGILMLIRVGQAASTLYWDANGTANGVGGNGTWTNGGGNWSTNNPAAPAANTTTTWTNTNRDTADFRGTAGVVTTSGSVAVGLLSFNAGGYTVSGSTPITLGRATGPGDATLINYAAGMGDTLLSPSITIDDSVLAANVTLTINNSAAGKLTLGGNIVFGYTVGPAAGNKAILLSAATAGSTIVTNGAIGGSAGGTATDSLIIGTNSTVNGTYNLNGVGVFGSATTINGGTVYLGNASALGASFLIGSASNVSTASLLTNGAYTVGSTSAVEFKGTGTANYAIGGATADDSSYSAAMKLTSSGQAIHFTAAGGGRVAFSAGGTGAQPYSKDGAGVVAFTAAGGNAYTGAFTINSGTFLAMNTATGTSATGSSSITLAATGALGGTGYIGTSGISNAVVNAAGAGSTITPGDMSRAGLSSIGTLHLVNGLSAPSGVTFNYDLNGASIDQVDYADRAVALSGPVTFNFTNLGASNSVLATPYSLFTGTGAWTGTPTFSIVPPDGYGLNTAYGTNGYLWDPTNHALTVEFSVPEPAALAVLSALGILAARRRRAA